MVFWIGIIVGGLFVLWAVWKGFYETWVRLFNSLISIYLAVFLRPTAAVFIPSVADSPYSSAITVFLLFVAFFLILESLSYIFFTSQFDVPFPRILDYIGSGIIGFFNGLLIWSFICLLISVTPVKDKSFFAALGFGKSFQVSNIAYIEKFLDPINSFLSLKSNFTSTNKMITEFIKESEKKEMKQEPSALTFDPNQISDSNNISEPNNTSESRKANGTSQTGEPNNFSD